MFPSYTPMAVKLTTPEAEADGGFPKEQLHTWATWLSVNLGDTLLPDAAQPRRPLPHGAP